MQRIKSLLVCCKGEVCNIMADFIGNQNYICDIANSLSDAEKMLSLYEYNYVMMEIKIPYYVENTPFSTIGIVLLHRIRNRFTKRTLPIVVFTEEKGKFASSGLSLYDIGANEILQYDSCSIVENGIDNKFKSNFREKIRCQLYLPSAWLTRSMENGKVIWKTESLTGKERVYAVKYNSTRCKLLDCIYNSLSYMEIIDYKTIRDACEWVF